MISKSRNAVSQDWTTINGTYLRIFSINFVVE